MNPLRSPLYGAASWVLVVAVLASSFAALLGTAAAASSTTYTLAGFVDQPGGPGAPPVPAGVTVDLVSRATGATYTTTVTGSGGQFSFTSSSTSSALEPGYWGLYVPSESNVSLTGCKHCAVLPALSAPTFAFYNKTFLTNTTYTTVIGNVSILPYQAILNGTVTQNGTAVSDATVKLLAPGSDGFVFSTNTTNATGFYNLSVPFGTWLLQTTRTLGPYLYTNSTNVTIASSTPPQVSPKLHGYAISGRILSSVTHSYVTTVGNATLFDPTSHYLYTTATPVGGYYSFATYPAGFTSGNQTFNVILSSGTFQTSYYNLTVNSTTPQSRSLALSPISTASLGWANTTLNFSGISPATGKGTLAVNTSVNLGNDSVIAGLPNATVGQLWAQLGLDFNHTLELPAGDLATYLKPWLSASGPFFPAYQAGTTVNGTPFYGPNATQPIGAFSSTCAGYCGLNSAARLTYSWSNSYTLNGTVPKNASSYTISFHFAHPSSPAVKYEYTVVLPSGYALSAGTTAPTHTSLVGKGSDGNWTTFTLVSNASSTPAAVATFTAVKVANLTVNLNVTSSSFYFSSANILNKTHGNYTVVLAPGENATFSAAATTYPSGANGTSFVWNFGDGNNTTTPNVTTNHTYTRVSGATPYDGTLKVISSSGVNNTTSFYIWVENSIPTAGIHSSATAAQQKKAGGVAFLFVNWSTTLQFNASNSSAGGTHDAISIALFNVTAKNYSASQNFSVSKGAKYTANWTVSFGSKNGTNTTAPGHGYYINLANVKFNSTPSGVTGWGWIYNMTLTVWTATGTSASTKLTILIYDSQKPIASFQILNSVGSKITTGSIVEGPNHYALIQLNATPSVDLGNGSILKYTWLITNPGNSSFTNITNLTNLTSPTPLPKLKLVPMSTTYKIKLSVTDKNGNVGNTTQSLQVSPNTTTRPIMEASNLTGPTTVNAGSAYTFWVNVTVGGGALSIANNVTVSFYLLSASGTGSKKYIAGTPGSVVFYGYSNNSTNATVNTTPIATVTPGVIENLSYNVTVRAQISWTPSQTGSYILYAQAFSTDQFNNSTSVSIASLPISVHPNPTTQLIEYGGIAAGVVVVFVLLYLFYRRRTRKTSGGGKPSSGRSGLERGASKPAADDDDEP